MQSETPGLWSSTEIYLLCNVKLCQYFAHMLPFLNKSDSTSSLPFLVMLIWIIINYKKVTLMYLLNTIVFNLIFVMCTVVLLFH